MTATVVFSSESEGKQLVDLRQFYNERGAQFDKNGSSNLFENFKELLLASPSILATLPNEKDLEALLNSLFSLLSAFNNNEELTELVRMFCALLTDDFFHGQGWNSNAGVSVRLLSNLFHYHSSLPGLQLEELKSLLLMAGRARLTQFLDIDTASVEGFAKRWQLDLEKQRELLRALHAALCQDERHEQAAEVMSTLLKTYTDQDAAKAREDARECVRTAVVDPKSFCFDHLLHLSAVKSLEQTDPLMFKVLDIFVNHSLPAYRQFTAQNPDFVSAQLKVDPKVLEKKMQTLTLITLAEKKKTLPLAELSKQLEIPDEEALEEFLIDAIRAEAINGKIDEFNKQLVVTFHQQRVFGRPQWEQLQARIGVLLENLGAFHHSLQTVVIGDEANGVGGK